MTTNIPDILDFASRSFSWERINSVIGRGVAKLFPLIPVFGYLVLFNDYMAEYLTFEKLLGGSVEIAVGWKMRWFYFGLTALGVARTVWHFAAPLSHKMATSDVEFCEVALGSYPPYAYNIFYKKIQHSDLDIAVVARAGQPQLLSDCDRFSAEFRRAETWSALKERHEHTMRALLFAVWEHDTRANFFLRLLVSALIGVGFVFLLVPTIDVFLKVARATVGA